MPDFTKIVRGRIAALGLTASAESELTEELARHLEDRFHDLRGSGLTDSEALRSALAELTDLHPLQSRLERLPRLPKHDAPSLGEASPRFLSGEIWRDLRYACRTIRKNPTFALFVVLTLALGIGANTTVFTVVNTLVLNPLPVPDSFRLAAVSWVETKRAATSAAPQLLSFANLRDLQAGNQVFTSLAGYSTTRAVTYQANGVPQRLFAELVTGNYFSTLRLAPARGRFFLSEEDGAPGAHAVAVLSYAAWQGHFGGAGDILGSSVRLNNLAFTIVGVGPPGFIGVNAIFGPDFWIPAAMSEQLLSGDMRDALSDRGKAAFQGLGRLAPSQTRDRAQANIANLAAALARDYPAANEGHTAILRPVTDVLDGSGGPQRSPVALGSALLLVVAGIVLLIACSNVANLLQSRSASRQQEIAIRLAMGASRARLVRQLLTESLVLGLFSGGLGLLFGYAGTQFLWSFRPSEVAANLIAPRMDATVFVFALLVSLATGFIFGTIPALRASRTSVSETLKEEARTTGRSRRKLTFANVLLTGQVAFSFLALMTAGLFLRSIERAYSVDPGFQTRHLAVLMTYPGQAGYGKPQVKAFYKDVRERVARLPGVESASWSSALPLFSRAASGLAVEGRAQRSKTDTLSAVVKSVDPGYFRTTGIALDRGRDFTEQDQESSTPVAIVNEKLARDYWPEGGAMEKRIQAPGETFLRQIVGIARTSNYTSAGEPPQPCVYLPLEQHDSDARILYVRSKGDPAEVLLPVQREVRAAGPGVTVDDIRTGRKVLDQSLFTFRVGVALLGVFGLLALALASVGLYGAMAYGVQLRRREIGMRMALGAGQGTVLRLVLRQGMSLVLAGMALGLAASLATGRMLSGMLFGISPADPASAAGAASVLAAVALLACYLPARRASRVDPMTALHEG